MSGVARIDRLWNCAKQSAHDATETIASVTHRQQFQLIGWPSSAPATPYCLRRVHGRQCALELVWNN
jgi:hypothetical protein